MNPIGLVAAGAAFGSIWFGHVAVRKIEFHSATIWLPAGTFVLAGTTLEVGSWMAHTLAASTALGIVGITLMWDALELVRQQRRVRKGHAPANPRNPRHAAFLAEAGSDATTVNVLKGEPEYERQGSAEESGIIIEGL